MPREHDELIRSAKSAPDIETALGSVLHGLAGNWREVVSRNDSGKGAAMSDHLGMDADALVKAVLDHGVVFKPEPGPPAPTLASQLKGTPRVAVRPLVQDPGESDADFAYRQSLASNSTEPQKFGPRGPVLTPIPPQQPGESDADFAARQGLPSPIVSNPILPRRFGESDIDYVNRQKGT